VLRRCGKKRKADNEARWPRGIKTIHWDLSGKEELLTEGNEASGRIVAATAEWGMSASYSLFFSFCFLLAGFERVSPSLSSDKDSSGRGLPVGAGRPERSMIPAYSKPNPHKVPIGVMTAPPIDTAQLSRDDRQLRRLD
jgi:hypothetical protein